MSILPLTRLGLVPALLACLATVADADDCLFQLDDGTAESGLGPNSEFFWGNAFDAPNDSGCRFLRSILVAFHETTPPGSPARLFVYDGNFFGSQSPLNRPLLAGPIPVITAREGEGFHEYVLPQPIPLPGGGRFLVGVSIDAAGFPAAIDLSSDAGASWEAFDLTDPDNPLHDPGFLAPLSNGNFMIRAQTGLVFNRVCPGDVDGDLDSDVDDLVRVITAWGTDGIDEDGTGADLNNDFTVDVEDLVIVITSWGECVLANDACADAPLLVAAGFDWVFPFDCVGPAMAFPIEDATIDDDVLGLACAHDAVADVWFRAFLPGTRLDGSQYELEVDVSESDFEAFVELYTPPDGQGCPLPISARRGCAAGHVIEYALPAGSTGQGQEVWIRVGTEDPVGVGRIRLCARDFGPGEAACLFSPVVCACRRTLTVGEPFPFANILWSVPQPEAVLCAGETLQGVRGEWYAVTGTGEEFTLSWTLDGEDPGAAHAQVFCGPCDALDCVAADDPAGNASSVTWCSEAGEEYIVLLYSLPGEEADYFEVLVEESACAASTECTTSPFHVNDACVDALPITDGVHFYTTLQATTDGPAHPLCARAGDGGATVNDVWFLYTATSSGTLRVSTCAGLGGDASDSDVVVYDADAVPDPVCDHLEDALLACNDDDPDRPCGGPADFQSTVEFKIEDGRTYLIRVGNWAEGTPGGDGRLVVERLR